ncbi:MAG: hypothetical protein IJS61_11465 [Firmicutes bacterium]|nr:hypothetical protein [Bacillota bacterium]
MSLKEFIRKYPYHIAAIVTVVLVLSVFLSVAFAPYRKIMHSLNAEKYSEALQIYKSSYKNGKGDKNLNKNLLAQAEKYKSQYIETGNESLITGIETIRDMGVNDIKNDIETIYRDMLKVKNDKDSIAQVYEYEKKADFKKAVSACKNIAEDSPYYEEALNMITKINGEAVDKYISDDNYYDLLSYVKANALEDKEILNKVYDYLSKKAENFSKNGESQKALNTVKDAVSYLGPVDERYSELVEKYGEK